MHNEYTMHNHNHTEHNLQLLFLPRMVLLTCRNIKIFEREENHIIKNMYEYYWFGLLVEILRKSIINYTDAS